MKFKKNQNKKINSTKIFFILTMIFLVSLNFGCANAEAWNFNRAAGKELVKEPVIPQESIKPDDEIIVKVSYKNETPKSIPFVQKFKGDTADYLYYGIIMAEKANLRSEPISNSTLVAQLKFYERVELLEEVEYKDSQWYKVATAEGKVGYLYKPYLTKRIFRFEKALGRIEEVEKFIRDAKENGEQLALVSAYTPDSENKHLSKKRDKYGKYKIQSAEGRYNNEILYIPDRSISKIVKNETKVDQLKVESMTEPYVSMEEKSIAKAPRLEEKPIKKAIIIDIENQNLILYEKIDGRWTIVSYGYSKTGYESELGFETPRGSFIMDIAKEKMLYTGIDGKVQGFANNAMRFSGGGYLHGTPISLAEANDINYYAKFREGFLGTFNGTRKCVRTTREHARFVYAWALGKEVQKPLPSYEVIKDNVLFIVF